VVMSVRWILSIYRWRCSHEVVLLDLAVLFSTRLRAQAIEVLLILRISGTRCRTPEACVRVHSR
jgi:hypothetical protein